MRFKEGDAVSYHLIIGGPVTSTGHKIRLIDLAPNDFGQNVAWITGKSGCVALTALSNESNPMKPAPKPLTKSQERYRAYTAIGETTDENFGEWLKNHYWDDYRAERGVA